LDFFKKLGESDDEKVIQLGYLIFTSLKLRAIVAPKNLLRHLETAEVQEHVLRYLTIARLDMLDSEVIDVLLKASQKKLVMAALWRFADYQKFVGPILRQSEALVGFEPRDVLKLFVILMGVRENRTGVSELPILPQILTRVTETGDLELLAIIRRFVRRLVLTVVIVQALEEAGFIKAYIDRTVQSKVPEMLKECCYVLDALLHVTCPLSALAFLPTLAEMIEIDPSVQKYGLPLLVQYSYYRQSDADMSSLSFLNVLTKVNIVPENHIFVDQLKANVAIVET
jgi:hypothetical protein